MTCAIGWCTADADAGRTHCTVHGKNPEFQPQEPSCCKTCSNSGGVKCSECDGTGEVPCEACNGLGEQPCSCGRARTPRAVRGKSYDMVYADGKWRRQGRLNL